jgi:hypothetical protein
VALGVALLAGVPVVKSLLKKKQQALEKKGQVLKRRLTFITNV